jgi:hypothetical protein
MGWERWATVVNFALGRAELELWAFTPLAYNDDEFWFE